ncbi:MAG TPA: polysaccharide biosynthesis/export family protein [Chthoniobacteraceae bacterium]|jgi:polysaccharide export outer membrane protein|nr:polysaccharide biosynthesis/export family protein [Chthoniobacteraceae bacterium]
MKYLALGIIALLGVPPILCAQSQQTAAKAIPRAEAVQPAAAPAAITSEPAIPLRPGDVVDIRIANVPIDDIQQWDAPYTVDESGMLNLPFVGTLKAGGYPPSQVETLIQNKLISDGIYTNPTISVTPPTGMRFISVGGAVRAPGRIPYTSDLTLMTVINAAGGRSDFAGDKVRLIRSGKVINYSWKKLEKDPSKDPEVQPSDQIEVVESNW